MIYVYRKLGALIDSRAAATSTSREAVIDDLCSNMGFTRDRLRLLLNNCCSTMMLTEVDRLCLYFRLSSVSELLEFEQ